MTKLWNNVGRLVARDLLIHWKCEWSIKHKKEAENLYLYMQGEKKIRKIKFKKMH